MLIAAAIAASTAAPPQHAEPRRQATATVRIVRAEPLRFAEMEQKQPAALRSSLIRDRDGKLQAARLFEYQ